MKIREIYNKLLANYCFTSLTISGTIFLIFLFFTTKVKCFPFDFPSLLVSAVLSILIGYQYAIKKSFLSRVSLIFEKISHLFQNNQYQKFSQCMGEKFHKSWLYYLTIIAVVAPFMIIELIKIWKWKWSNGPTPPYFYLFEPTLWSLLLDIISHIFGYLMLALLAVIIWIMIELTFIVNELKEKYEVNIDIFNVDETGGLQPLRSFIQSMLSTYFIIITLAILSNVSPTATILFYISPTAIITYEIIILVLMLLIGIILFLITQITIRNLIDKGVNSEFEKINKKYKEIYDKIYEISFNKRTNDKEKELHELCMIINILEKEEIKINLVKNKRHDIKTIIIFITTVLVPIISLIKEIISFTGSQ